MDTNYTNKKVADVQVGDVLAAMWGPVTVTKVEWAADRKSVTLSYTSPAKDGQWIRPTFDSVSVAK